MRSRPGHVSRLVPLAVVPLLLVAGCSGDTSDASSTASSTAPSDSPSSSPSSVSSPVSSPGSPSASSSDAASPSVTPAVGTTYQRQSFGFTLPAAFTATGDVGNGVLRTADFGAESLGCFFSVAEIGGADIVGYDLDDAADLALSSAESDLTRQSDREVGGQQVYVLTGGDAGSPSIYQVGRVAGTRVATLTFRFIADAPTNQQVVDSVLATVTWND